MAIISMSWLQMQRLRFAVVRGEAAPFRSTRDALAWCRANGVLGAMSDAESGGKGVVTISAESIRESLNPRQRAKSVSDDIHFAAVPRLRELIRESRILETHGDWTKNAQGVRDAGSVNANGISICIAYAAFLVLGVVYRVRLTLKRYAQTGTSKPYAYRVNEIEVVPGTLGGRPKLATDPTGTTSICANSLLQGARSVNGGVLLTNIKVVSGGQTGVDQGALEAAVELGLDYGGWAPYGWLAEVPLGAIPTCYRAKMREYPDQGSNTQNYRERTKANVRDSHATLILVDDLPLTGGTKLTNDFAALIMRSHCVIDMSSAHAKEDALQWLRQFLGMSSALVLNVAGPRESKSPGIQARAREFLSGPRARPQWWGKSGGGVVPEPDPSGGVRVVGV